MADGSYGEWAIARWAGGVFYWLLSGCRKKLADQLIERYDSRNAWTGYFIYLLLLIGMVSIAIALFS